TITVAAVVLGHLPAGGRLAGGLELDGAASHAAVADLAGALGMDTTATAAGVIAIGAASMANSVRAVTTERGLDPRDFALFAYGGNGPLHISLVARELGVRKVVVPPFPAVFAALGMLMADVRRDIVQTGVRTLGTEDAVDAETEGALEGAFAELERECARALRDGAVRYEGLDFQRAADMRYVGQEHTVTVPVPEEGGAAELKRAFDRAHGERYGHSAPQEPAQIVSLRVSAVGTLGKPDLPKIAAGGAEPPAAALTGSRDIVFTPAQGPVRSAVYAREALLAGNTLAGPAVVEEPTATTLLRPGDTLDVDAFGNLLLTIGQ
ncbi:MAG: hydantoinase/oxoprolinase family protein, partial [Streptomyces sp.]|nr:hydantoinase/oxoprolinase family protein [Streptomyces sp.]